MFNGNVSQHIVELQKLLESEEPVHGDVLVWLQGDRYDRAEKIIELYKKNYAPRILITGTSLLIGKDIKPEENNISLDDMKQWLLERGVEEKNIIIDEGAMNTREQAEHVITRAIQNDWKTVIIVSSIQYHIRAFLTFLRYMKEIGWKGTLLNQMVKLKWSDIPGGRIRSAEEYFIETVKKIYTYRNHVASPEEGILYLKNRGSEN